MTAQGRRSRWSPETHFEKIHFHDMERENLRRNMKGGWAAMTQQYFIGAWIPPREDTEHYYSKVLFVTPGL